MSDAGDKPTNAGAVSAEQATRAADTPSLDKPGEQATRASGTPSLDKPAEQTQARPVESAGQPAIASPTPEPTPVIPASEATKRRPPGTAAPDTGAPDVIGPPDKPEVAIGAAFAGGFVVALVLKRIFR